MEWLIYFLIALLILGAILYAVVWALSTDFFLKEGTTEFDAWKAVLWIAIFLLVLAVLGYLGLGNRVSHMAHMHSYESM